jgi:hypothetical protein
MTIDDPGWGEYIPPADGSGGAGSPGTGQQPPAGGAPGGYPPGGYTQGGYQEGAGAGTAPGGYGPTGGPAGGPGKAPADQIRTWLAVPRNRGIAAGVGGAVLLIIILIVALGGGNSKSLTTAQFVSDANATCVSAATTLNPAIASGNTGSIVAAGDSMVSQLQGIGLPTDSSTTSGEASQWISDLQALLVATKADNTSVGTSEGVAANSLAAELGLTSCELAVGGSGNT